jgi:CspA family cold shock protein
MSKGKVKWFSDLKGYGFITSADDLCDVYVHHTDIRIDGYKTLKVGESVEYEVAQTPEGPKARNVVKVS